MARKNYSEELRRQAVDLYESTPGATVRGIAEDLWHRARHAAPLARGVRHRQGDRTRRDADDQSVARQARPRGRASATAGAADETPEQEVIWLRARVNELEVETTKLTTEREILQRAAKYFAGRRAGESLPVRPDNSATYRVKRLCELVEIERSSYYAGKAGAPARAAADAELAQRIRAVHGADNTRRTTCDRRAQRQHPG